MKKHPPVPPEKELEIIEFFKTQRDNRTNTIASAFEVQPHQVEKIINDFLKPLAPKIY
jgi:hypothetical protein